MELWDSVLADEWNETLTEHARDHARSRVSKNLKPSTEGQADGSQRLDNALQ